MIGDSDLERESRELLRLLRGALVDGGSEDFEATAWEPVRDYLSNLSRSRAEARVLAVADGDFRVLAQAAAVRPLGAGSRR